MFFPTLPRRELLPRSTYYDKHYRMTSAMIRARQQYLVKNIVAGVSLTVFVLGVYAYTIKAVAQDDLSDIPMPEAPPQPAPAPSDDGGLGIKKQAMTAKMKQ